MAKTCHMTWVPGGKRWLKQYRGRTFAVSCRQLACPPSKEASWAKANEWWAAKQQEVDGEASPPDPATQTFAEVVRRTPVDRLHELVEEGEAAKKALAILNAQSIPEGEMAVPVPGKGYSLVRMPVPENAADAILAGERVRPAVVDRVLGTGDERERVRKLGRLASTLAPDGMPVTSDKSVGGQVQSWLTFLRARVAAREINEGRYDSYRATAYIFRDWLGADKPVEAVTSIKLEDFQAHLLTQIGERRRHEEAGSPQMGKGLRLPGYSTAYARTIMGTVKMFVARLAEHGLVPTPGNLRRLKITAQAGVIETLTVEEFGNLLAGCDGQAERTKLYLLLMANCGFYQSDISDLGTDEVDLDRGTITRPRSKTPNGPVVTYALWPETLALLRKHRNTDRTILNDRRKPRVLVTAKKGPLVPVSLPLGGNLSKSDNVQSAYRRLTARLRLASPKPLKLIRKTSASLLAGHKQYKFFAQYFLGHSPRSVADQHYVRPNDSEFAEALGWLRSQYGLCVE